MFKPVPVVWGGWGGGRGQGWGSFWLICTNLRLRLLINKGLSLAGFSDEYLVQVELFQLAVSLITETRDDEVRGLDDSQYLIFKYRSHLLICG